MSLYIILRWALGRTSHEVRGLKLLSQANPLRSSGSHLTRGAWIEMLDKAKGFLNSMSHLTRGAWIEISIHSYTSRFPLVAPHTRCVD